MKKYTFQTGGDNQYTDTSIFNLIGQYAQQPNQNEQDNQTETEDTKDTVSPNEESEFSYKNEDFKSLQDKYDALEKRVNDINSSNYSGDDNFLNFLFDDSKNNDPIDFNYLANKKTEYKQNLAISPTENTYSPSSSVTYTSPVSGKFQAFNTPEAGRAALERQLDLYKSGESRNTTGNETLYQAMGIYAPSSDGNNPKHYAEFIAKKIGVNPNTPIKQIDTKKWADAVAQMEGNKHGNNPGNLRPYQMGGSISQQGYNYDSPYKNEPYLDIHSPTGNITMENTRIPLLGIDEYGNKQLMHPNQKYKFQGQHIREIKL